MGEGNKRSGFQQDPHPWSPSRFGQPRASSVGGSEAETAQLLAGKLVTRIRLQMGWMRWNPWPFFGSRMEKPRPQGDEVGMLLGGSGAGSASEGVANVIF